MTRQDQGSNTITVTTVTPSSRKRKVKGQKMVKTTTMTMTTTLLLFLFLFVMVSSSTSTTRTIPPPAAAAARQRRIRMHGIDAIAAKTTHRDLVVVEEEGQNNDTVMVWKPVRSYDTATTVVNNDGGRHHPITFANETHGFVIGGTVQTANGISDRLLIFEEQTQSWTDNTMEFLEINNITFATSPLARSFGYGVVLPIRDHSKAYFGFGLGLDYDSATTRLLNDLWEFDMSTLQLKQLTPCPCLGRRHPSMVPVMTSMTTTTKMNNTGTSTSTNSSNIINSNSTISDGEDSSSSSSLLSWQIHIGLGDGLNNSQFQNFNDYWSYDISTDSWNQLPNFPSSKRHHPFFFSVVGGVDDNQTTTTSKSYVGLGHSDGNEPLIERDFYSFQAYTEAGGIDYSLSTSGGTWARESDFESYDVGFVSSSEGSDVGGSIQQQPTPVLVSTEARVAGTQFSITLPLVGGNDEETSSSNETATTLKGSLGFVLSGDGDDHGPMATGEFHAFDPNPSSPVTWFELPPHPGPSRWAPGSWVMRGTTRVYFTSGYDRSTGTLYDDVWTIDVRPLFQDSQAVASAAAGEEISETQSGSETQPNTTATNSNRASMPSSSSSLSSSWPSPKDPSEQVILPPSSSSSLPASKFGVKTSRPHVGLTVIATTFLSTVLLNHLL